MADKKFRSKEFTTGIAVLEYPFLNQPRQYDGKGDFYYDVKARLFGTDAAALKRFVEAEVIESERFHGGPLNAFANPLKDIEDADGNVGVEFKAKQRAHAKDGSERRKPNLLGPDGVSLTATKSEPRLASGTKARLCLRSYRWKSGQGCGVTLQPIAVQLIEVVEYAGRSAKSYGFAPVDTGEGDTSADPASGADF